MCCVESESFSLNNSLWDWESELQREICCIVEGWGVVLRRIGKLLPTRLDTNLQNFDFEALHTSLRDGGFLHVGSSAKMWVDEINLGMVWWRVGGCKWLVAGCG